VGVVRDSKLRRLTLGLVTARSGSAREAWRVARKQLNKGLEPVPIVPGLADDAGSVRKVVEDWLKRDQSTNRKYGTPARAYAEVERIMKREVLPRWGNTSACSVVTEALQMLGVFERGWGKRRSMRSGRK